VQIIWTHVTAITAKNYAHGKPLLYGRYHIKPLFVASKEEIYVCYHQVRCRTNLQYLGFNLQYNVKILFYQNCFLFWGHHVLQQEQERLALYNTNVKIKYKHQKGKSTDKKIIMKKGKENILAWNTPSRYLFCL
jgi:hypothetical protein